MKAEAASISGREVCKVIALLLVLLAAFFALGYSIEYSYELQQGNMRASIRWWPVLNLLFHYWLLWNGWDFVVQKQPELRFFDPAKFSVRRLTICLGVPTATFLICAAIGVSRSFYLTISHVQIWILFTWLLTRKDPKMEAAIKQANADGSILIPKR